MSLQDLIKDKLTSFNKKDLAKGLGYSSTKKLSLRVEAVVNSETLSLDSSQYDFHYSTPEFIRKICDVLSIPSILYNAVIDEVEEKLQAEKRRYKPFLFIETNFKRKNEPVFALAALESKRYIAIEKTQAIALNDRLEYIQELIKSHYAEQTELLIWGKIIQYVYFHDEKTIIVFSTSGEVVDAVEQYSRSRATMNLR